MTCDECDVRPMVDMEDGTISVMCLCTEIEIDDTPEEWK